MSSPRKGFHVLANSLEDFMLLGFFGYRNFFERDWNEIPFITHRVKVDGSLCYTLGIGVRTWVKFFFVLLHEMLLLQARFSRIKKEESLYSPRAGSPASSYDSTTEIKSESEAEGKRVVMKQEREYSVRILLHYFFSLQARWFTVNF